MGKTLCSSAGGLGLIPAQGIKSHMLKLRVHMQQLKILCVANKTQCSQINKNCFNKLFLKNKYIQLISGGQELSPGSDSDARILSAIAHRPGWE